MFYNSILRITGASTGYIYRSPSLTTTEIEITRCGRTSTPQHHDRMKFFPPRSSNRTRCTDEKPHILTTEQISRTPQTQPLLTSMASLNILTGGKTSRCENIRCRMEKPYSGITCRDTSMLVSLALIAPLQPFLPQTGIITPHRNIRIIGMARMHTSARQ